MFTSGGHVSVIVKMCRRPGVLHGPASFLLESLHVHLFMLLFFDAVGMLHEAIDSLSLRLSFDCVATDTKGF